MNNQGGRYKYNKGNDRRDVHYKKTKPLLGKFTRKTFPRKNTTSLLRLYEETSFPRKVLVNLREKRFLVKWK